jgi:hypothetical protein
MCLAVRAQALRSVHIAQLVWLLALLDTRATQVAITKQLQRFLASLGGLVLPLVVLPPKALQVAQKARVGQQQARTRHRAARLVLRVQVVALLAWSLLLVMRLALLT